MTRSHRKVVVIGAERLIDTPLGPQEREQLQRSAGVLRNVLRDVLE